MHLPNNPHSKEELTFMVGEWQRQPLTRSFITYLKELESECLKAAVHNRRDHQASLQKLERACVLEEVLKTINAGTFIK